MMALFRVSFVLGIIVCFSYAQEFLRFKQFPLSNGNTCVHTQFITQGTLFAKCMLLCKRSFGCKRMFYIAGGNICIGCSSLEAQTATNVQSLSYVVSMTTMNYMGCYNDAEIRAMVGAFTDSYFSMTIGHCVQFCMESGFLYAGLQYYFQCFCGDTYDRYGKANEGLCSMPCPGNTKHICGGSLKNSVYFTL